MNFKKQIFISFFSAISIIIIAYIFWLMDENYEYSSLAISIDVILSYFLALLCGIIVAAKISFGLSKIKSIGLYNLIGTFNILISIIIFIYIFTENGNKLSWLSLIFLPTFIIGLFIFENIYLDNFSAKDDDTK